MPLAAIGSNCARLRLLHVCREHLVHEDAVHLATLVVLEALAPVVRRRVCVQVASGVEGG
jgi:hypothetical protein